MNFIYKLSGGFSTTEKTLFLIGLLIKIALGAVLASSFLTELFAPFIKYFLVSGFADPYSHFHSLDRDSVFPYPAGMLYIMSLPQLLVPHSLETPTFIELLLYRVPLLFADMTIFFILRSWLSPRAAQRVVWLYWLSPVLIYISYIHGQFDVIPISLLFVAMHFLFRERIIYCAIFVGLSIATKTNVMLIYPLFVLYFMAQGNWVRPSIQFVAFSTLTFLLINLPFLFHDSFIEMVLRNAEQSKVFLSILPLNDLNFFIVPAGWFLLMALGARSGLGNRDVFIMFLGFAFCIVLILIPPMHGWYFWIIPFFTYFYAKERSSSLMLFFTMQGLYLLYFLISPASDYLDVFQMFLKVKPALGTTYSYLNNLNIDAATLHNIIFTFLQSSLFLICIQIYTRGLARYRGHKITGKPFLIGIGGDSGAGKSTLSGALSDVFTNRNVTTLRGDDQHKWKRGHEKWDELTHLNPKANFLHKEISMLRKLATGKKIYRQLYDHNTGNFTSEIEISPKRLMILEGLHPFYLEDQRTLFDLKIFMAPEPELMLHWKISRDIVARNYTTEQVLEQVASRKDDSERYIEAQSQFADLVIIPKATSPIGNLGGDEAVDMYYEIVLPNSIHIDPAISMLEGLPSLTIEHHYKDVNFQTIEISGNCIKEDIEGVSSFFLSKLQEIGVQNMQWPSGLFGVVLFMVVYCIFEEAENGKI